MKKVISIVLVLAFITGPTPGVAKTKSVACLGDSITEGIGLPDMFSNCYPAQLEKLLRQFDPNWETRNFGATGATVLRQGDIPYVNQSDYNQALASEPDVVIFCFGTSASRTNNQGLIQEFFVSDYIELIDAFAELPSKPKMWICYPLKAFSTAFTVSDEIIKDQIIPLIDEVASEKGLPVIDLYSAFEDSPHLYHSDDGIHPTSNGAELMAQIIAAFITGVRATPDFNSDGIVDSADICIMVDYWHTDEPSCDIAPPPFGDGTVDVLDLAALAEYLFIELDMGDPTLVGHWALDETGGNIAYDRAGTCDGTLSGTPVWQPADGMVDGALQFDGVDDFILISIISPLLNSIEGPFSVFAWVKDGAPGQVVISQRAGVNWLCADTSEGNLMTELKGTGRDISILSSKAVITDGNWHRIGLVWDGSHRTLYVDGVVVAEDTLANLEVSSSGLYIGTGKTRETGTYWSGLIDDVRIYNRAVIP